jgi:hypothetical protein
VGSENNIKALIMAMVMMEIYWKLNIININECHCVQNYLNNLDPVEFRIKK